VSEHLLIVDPTAGVVFILCHAVYEDFRSMFAIIVRLLGEDLALHCLSELRVCASHTEVIVDDTAVGNRFLSLKDTRVHRSAVCPVKR
jgi:hypothetical protein